MFMWYPGRGTQRRDGEAPKASSCWIGVIIGVTPSMFRSAG